MSISKSKENQNNQNSKPRFKVPDTYVLIFLMVVVATILTYVIPAGQYDLVVDPVSGRNVVDGNSFHYIEQTPIGFMDFLMAIPKGLNKAAKIIMCVFMVGGAFQIIQESKALDLSMHSTIKRFGNKALLIIPILMGLTALLGTASVMISTCIAFVPLGLVIAKRLDVDPIFAVAIVFLGSHIAFVASPICPVTTVVAQQIAGIPIYSGMAFRTGIVIVMISITIAYVMIYANKVRKDKSKSVMGQFSFDNIDEVELNNEEFSFKHFAIIAIFFIAFGLFAYGSKSWKWGINHLAGLMIPVALLCGFISSMSPSQIAKEFVKGARGMLYGALLIGFASAISVVLTQGNIMHTMIYSMSKPLTNLGPTISAIGMFFINAIFNVFVPSGSGQAMVVTPIMAPLGDIVGITRQTSILAYQLGDGLTNVMIPTYGILMGCLGLANVPFEKWLKWILPLIMMLATVAIIALVIAVNIGWA